MPNRQRRRANFALAMIALLTLVALMGAASSRASAPGAYPLQSAAPRFLTLPFTDSRVALQQGWLYSWGSVHGGADYVLRKPGSTTQLSFDVVAAADGWACGNCSSRQGNAVFIKHTVEGQTYYTYYGHLASIEPGIPVGSQKNTVWVQRGQRIGVSGSTGASTVHLHFQVNGPTPRVPGPVDPYDLGATAASYPPGCGGCREGPNALWIADPPSMAQDVALTPTDPGEPPHDSGGACAVTISAEQTVEGSLSDDAPEARYCLPGSAGETLTIAMFAAPGATLDTMLRVVGPGGETVAQDDDGAQVEGNSFLALTLPAGVRYELVATRFSGSGPYRLRIERGAKSSLGDLNKDCVVNAADVAQMQAALGSSDPWADINLDGSVDADDQAIQALRLGRGCMKLK